VMVTDALVTPAWPCLYTSSCKFDTRTCCSDVMPSTKQMASRMLLLPEPFRPVMALNLGSKSGVPDPQASVSVKKGAGDKPSMTVRVA